MDKTGLLEYLNEAVGTPNNCISVSHARRFGKSHAAGMIDAYYSRGCDSSALFENTEIAGKESFRKYLNQYHVVHLDIASVWDYHKEESKAFLALAYIITMNYEGLKEDVLTMLSGENVWGNTETFDNDLFEISSKDEVLTALIQIGDNYCYCERYML